MTDLPPLDPYATPTLAELVERVRKLEERKLTVPDLPLAALQRKLEMTWQPDAAVLLQPRSINNEMLADDSIDGRTLQSPYIFGYVLSAGTIGNSGSGGWTVARTGVGAYTVTFPQPFLSNPVLLLSVGATAGAIGMRQASGAVGSVGVQAFNTTTGAAIDSDFTFSAIGPR